MLCHKDTDNLKGGVAHRLWVDLREKQAAKPSTASLNDKMEISNEPK